MKNSFNKLFAVPLAALVLTSFTLAPIAEAREGGRGGGGGGGAARASGGGGGGGTRAAGGGGQQIDSSKRDARTNNVRNTSTNNVNSNRSVSNSGNTNVNANRNVNVNVENGGGCCGGGWDNDYHPVAAVVAVGATAAVIGSMVRTVPANCVPVNYGGIVYQQCGSTWYQPQGGQYVVINPPY